MRRFYNPSSPSAARIGLGFWRRKQVYHMLRYAGGSRLQTAALAFFKKNSASSLLDPTAPNKADLKLLSQRDKKLSQ